MVKRLLVVLSVVVIVPGFLSSFHMGRGESFAVGRAYAPPVLSITTPNTVIPPAPPVFMEMRGAGGTYLSTPIDPQPLYEVDNKVTPRELPGWWDRGVESMPSTDTLGTVLIVGHAQASSPDVFNPLMTATVNDQVTLKTAHGVLTYTVCEPPLLINKEAIADRSDLYDPVAGRLVLVMCNVDQGGDTLDNRVLVARLGNCSNPVG